MTTLTLNLTAAATLIRTVGPTNTILLRGQPGIGKSAILSTLAQQLPDYHAAYIDCASLDLGDIAMPVVDRDRMVTNYAPNARFGISPNQTKPVLLMLDELGKAPKPVLNMLLPVILERRLGSSYLPTGSICFATTNLDTDGVSDNVPAHVYNRMTVCRLANPTVTEWLSWAADHDIAPEVMAFVRDYPQVLECYADQSTTDNPYIFNPMRGVTKCFASPRSLAHASNIIKCRDQLPPDSLLPALAGTVGEAAARDMEAAIMLGDSLPKYAAITSAPATARLPEGAGAHFLMAFMLASRADKANLPALVTYVRRWSSFEAQVLFVSTLAANKHKVVMACSCRAFTEAAAAVGKYF